MTFNQDMDQSDPSPAGGWRFINAGSLYTWSGGVWADARNLVLMGLVNQGAGGAGPSMYYDSPPGDAEFDAGGLLPSFPPFPVTLV